MHRSKLAWALAALCGLLIATGLAAIGLSLQTLFLSGSALLWLRLGIDDLNWYSVRVIDIASAMVAAILLLMSHSYPSVQLFVIPVLASAVTGFVLTLIKQIGQRLMNRDVLGAADPIVAGGLCLSLTVHGIATLWILALPIGWVVGRVLAVNKLPLIYILVFAWYLIQISAIVTTTDLVASDNLIIEWLVPRALYPT